MNDDTRTEGKLQPAEAAPDEALLDDLVFANRILFDHGVVDAFGHVSVRHDKAADRFLLARNMPPAMVTRADIIEFDMDGNPTNANGRRVFLERFIHSAIFQARPDVHAVVHSHSPEVVPFSAAKGTALQAIWHMCGFLGDGVPIFEIRDVAGDGTDLLVRNVELGKALADALGNASVILMRGHGATVVGSDLMEAVYRAVYTQMNAEIQLHAHQLGTVTFLSKKEAQAASAAISTQMGRAWDLWKNQLKPSGTGDH